MLQHNPKLELADNFVRYTDKNIFLTGKAGTGKTTFLHQLRKSSPKRLIVTAPTGVAAINAKGVTLHSFFQLPFGPIIPGAERKDAGKFAKISSQKRNIMRSLDLLVIDEISMVRADVLDAVDDTLRRVRGSQEAFGGVQLLMIGDLQQLSPIARNEEWDLLKEHYDTVYFFSSQALKKSGYISVELNHIYRQSDETFIKILNEVRNDKLSSWATQELNKRYIPHFTPDEKEGYITLCTHNHQAQKINLGKLNQLAAQSVKFQAQVKGDFPEHMYPNDLELELKIGAQVMFIKNDPEPSKRFFNGKIGKLVAIDEDSLEVLCPGDIDSISVNMLKWENVKYTLHSETQEIEEEVVGSFTQYPLKTAWAITIHKSQGLTFEKAIIDSASSFAHGQVYVALSRCKSLEGLVLSSPVGNQAIICDEKVSEYNHYLSDNQPTDEQLQAERKNFEKKLLIELFDYQRLRGLTRGMMKRMEEILSEKSSQNEELQNALQLLETEILPLSTKFHSKIHQLYQASGQIEHSKELQDRIQKGSAYYEPFNEKLYQWIHDFEPVSENKVLKKKILELKGKALEILETKKQCLKHTRNGFDLKEFLAIRAKANLESENIKATIKTNPTQKQGVHSELYKTLLAWRQEIAITMGVVEHNILTVKTMRSIVHMLPKNLDQLGNVPGIGKITLKKYGLALLQMVLEYLDKNPSLDPKNKEIEKKQSLKEPKIPTRELSLQLFKQGKTVEEIALERNLAASTIYGHLADCARAGKLDVNELIEAEELARIQKLMDENPDKTFKEIIELSKNTIQYWQLKLVAPN